MGKNLLTILLSLYDKNTYAHVCRVAYYANEIGKQLNLSISEMNLLFYSSLLHDIGKIFIPVNLLEKEEKLTKEEYRLLQHHVEFGYFLLPESMMDIKNIIISHHERLDGSGYPYHKTEKEIPKLSKIIAIADSYDAMTSNRFYNQVKTEKEAMEELLNNTDYYGTNKYSFSYVTAFHQSMKKKQYVKK